MRVELVNWSGHGNLGDDAMAKILQDVFPDAINVGESPTNNADWYIVGGGTLLAPTSLFLGITPPEKTILVSVGVSGNWDGHGVEWLSKVTKIYARDFYTQGKLLQFNIQSELSADLVCYLKGKKRVRKGVWSNVMVTGASLVPGARGEALHEASIKRDRFFAMSPNEGIETKKDAVLYTDMQKLIDDLSGVQLCIATRLHAVVAAWIAGCDIRPIRYDIKIDKFLERVEKETPQSARRIVKKHLREIKNIIYD